MEITTIVYQTRKEMPWNPYLLENRQLNKTVDNYDSIISAAEKLKKDVFTLINSADGSVYAEYILKEPKKVEKGAKENVTIGWGRYFLDERNKIVFLTISSPKEESALRIARNIGLKTLANLEQRIIPEKQ